MSYKKMLPLVLAALLLWTVPASAAPETTLKVAVGDPEDSEMGVVGHAFKKYVDEKTGGKVEVQCFYGATFRKAPCLWPWAASPTSCPLKRSSAC